MERHLGIDFLLILVDFGRQVGIENRAKINSRRHRKSDEKKEGTKMDFDVLFGAKLEWEMDKYCVPKGIQKTTEKRGGGAGLFWGRFTPSSN